MFNDLILRDATPADAPAISALLRHYVETSIVTLDTQAPGPEFFIEKLAATQEFGSPFLTLETAQGSLVGYAYGAQYRPKLGYSSSVELTIYLADGWTGQGLGGPLLNALTDACRAAGFKLAISVITVDPAIGGKAMPSGKLHLANGFTYCDSMPTVAAKFGKYWDTATFILDLDPSRTAP